MKYIISIIAFLFLTLKLPAQEKCPSINLYKTKFVKDGNDTSGILRLALNFIFVSDSLIVSFDENGKNRFMDFKIMNKLCKWNDDFSEGESTYKLIMSDKAEIKYPILIIKSNKSSGKANEITLYHENGEIRIFGT